ncbi:YopX family protein [Paenibacillus sp. FSL M7-0802]|uniref:YopX family protein n=1 Tax=Paenibacillus sp. FSL M7-0802 TaxID=2921536 RepID=UPI0030FACBA8
MDNKHRGKDIETGEWIYGYLIGDNTTKNYIVDWHDIYFNTGFWYEVDPTTVSKSLGLPDKNGVEAYDKDILKAPDLYETPENTYPTYHNEVIEYREYAWHLGDQPLCYDYNYVSDECEIIGNIYDNPELLEV